VLLVLWICVWTRSDRLVVTRLVVCLVLPDP